MAIIQAKLRIQVIVEVTRSWPGIRPRPVLRASAAGQAAGDTGHHEATEVAQGRHRSVATTSPEIRSEPTHHQHVDGRLQHGEDRGHDPAGGAGRRGCRSASPPPPRHRGVAQSEQPQAPAAAAAEPDQPDAGQRPDHADVGRGHHGVPTDQESRIGQGGEDEQADQHGHGTRCAAPGNGGRAPTPMSGLWVLGGSGILTTQQESVLSPSDEGVPHGRCHPDISPGALWRSRK